MSKITAGYKTKITVSLAALMLALAGCALALGMQPAAAYADQAAAESTSLEAQEKVQYTVTFVTGSDATQINPQLVEKDGLVTKPATPKCDENYDCVGWLDEKGKLFDFSTKVTGDMTLTAAWSQQMFRLYNPNSGEHFYTASTTERDTLDDLGWNYEGVGWTAPVKIDGGNKNVAPVYRLYNENGGEHHYTTNKDERDFLEKAGWNYEGVGWYSDTGENVALYRQYNPNAFANNHNYTTSTDERDNLIKLGWQDEKIGWYGLA